jgi:hypothetical protein
MGIERRIFCPYLGSLIVGQCLHVSIYEFKLETHLRVAREIAILFTVVTDREDREPTRAGFVGRLNDQRHIGRFFGIPESSLPGGTFVNTPVSTKASEVGCVYLSKSKYL